MVTGGSRQKRPIENFDFSEPIWQDVSLELKQFLQSSLMPDPGLRASVDGLLESSLVFKARNA